MTDRTNRRKEPTRTMKRSHYRVTFVAGAPGERRAEEIDAEQIGHIWDGTVSWLNFHDRFGEVLRVRSTAVERIERMD